MSKRALLLINLHSKNGDSDINRALHVLTGAGIAVTTKVGASAEELKRLILQYQGEIDFVILGGGDGTLNAAASALLQTGLPLGILPMGTANDLARTLKIPFDIEEAAKVIAHGRLHHIDLGTANGGYFFNIANIGLGVQVQKNLSYQMKQRWGVFSYMRGFIKAFKSYQPFRAEIICDDRTRCIMSIQIAVGNGRHYGGGMTVSDAARIDDGMCFLYSVKPSPLWDVLKAAFAFRSGQFRQHHPVDLDHGSTIEIKTSRRMAVTADGEQITHTPARFAVHKAAIQVFVSDEYLEQSLEIGRVDTRKRTDSVK